jgi:hypothetical protein
VNRPMMTNAPCGCCQEMRKDDAMARGGELAWVI